MSVRCLDSRRLSLSLLLSALSFVGTWAIAETVCPPVAQAQSGDFGQPGQNGRDGRSGRAGRSGSDRTVILNGNTAPIDLSGEDGGDGESGENGRSAFCGQQPRDVNRNLRASDGGNGGNGGTGGNGGNGGNLTVYYTNPADLQRLLVNAAGGEGGRGGRGGNGSFGCNCQYRQWQVQSCTGTPGTPNYRCSNQVFSCTDGRDGRSGNNGADGRSGQLGQLSIINQPQPLAPESPSLTASLAALANQEVALSKNLWNLRRGAASLLAPGSSLADQYREYAGRAEGTFRLVWAATTPLQELANETATVQIQNDRTITLTSPEEVWLSGSSTQEGQVTTYRVAAIVRRQDATRLAVGNVTGRGSQLQMVVVDLAGKSDLLNTRFRIHYRTDQSFGDGAPDFRTRYDGEVPANLVSRDFNRFTLNVGQLPIGASYLTPGTPVQIEVTVVRSLGDRSAEQDLRWGGTLRR
jgi:hypothetical protein